MSAESVPIRQPEAARVGSFHFRSVDERHSAVMSAAMESCRRPARRSKPPPTRPRHWRSRRSSDSALGVMALRRIRSCERSYLALPLTRTRNATDTRARRTRLGTATHTFRHRGYFSSAGKQPSGRPVTDGGDRPRATSSPNSRAGHRSLVRRYPSRYHRGITFPASLFAPRDRVLPQNTEPCEVLDARHWAALDKSRDGRGTAR